MADEKYLSTLSGPELDAALRAAVNVRSTVRSELKTAKESGEFDGPIGPQGIQGPAGILEVPGQIQDFASSAMVGAPSFNNYNSFNTPLISGINGSKSCGISTFPAGFWTYQMFMLGSSDLPAILVRRVDPESGYVAEELEWINPPMDPETEYRTIERFSGKPVYKKHFSLNNVTGKKEIFLGNGTRAISVRGNDNSGALIPGPQYTVDANPGDIIVDFGDLLVNAEIEVSYIKI